MKTLDRTQAPEPGSVREFNFPSVERSSLANSLTVLSAHQGTLPVVTIMLVAQAGAELDTQTTAGLAQLTTNALEAGTTTRPADRLAWEFEILGTELEAKTAWDASLFAVTVMQDKLEPALALLAEVVTRPAFATQEIERLVGEQLSELEQRRADPRALASDMASRFLFAPDVPYARPIPGTAAAVKHLTDEHVRSCYERFWTPSNSALVVVGATDHASVSALASRHFASWTQRAGERVEVDVATSVERTQIFIVDRGDSVQSEIRVGHVGLARNTPDYFPLTVANGILGGVFTSRLNMSLREKHGFTYGVRSGFGFRKHPGPFLIQTAVATDVTARALEELLKETRQLVQDGATEEEVSGAKEYMAGVMPLDMQTTEQMADSISNIFVYGLSDDYLPQHRAALLAVSRDEVSRAAHDHIKPDEFAITIVGDAKSIESDLAALEIGPIEVHTS